MHKIKETENSVTYKSNRGKIYHFICQYADKTPEGFWEEVYCVLERCGVFDGLRKK